VTNFGIENVCKSNVGVNDIACLSEKESYGFLVTKIYSNTL